MPPKGLSLPYVSTNSRLQAKRFAISFPKESSQSGNPVRALPGSSHLRSGAPHGVGPFFAETIAGVVLHCGTEDAGRFGHGGGVFG